MKTLTSLSPFQHVLSFHKLIAICEEKAHRANIEPFEKKYLDELLAFIQPLKDKDDIFHFEDLTDYHSELKALLQFLFPESMTNNEIKALSFPLDEEIYYPTKRFQRLLDNAGTHFKLVVRDFNPEFLFQMHCAFILQKIYNVQTDFNMPLYANIDAQNGDVRHFKVNYNIDLTDVVVTEKAPKITKEDIDLLLGNIKDVDFWKEKFPPGSYIMKGITIVNLIDVTIDEAISSLKTTLLTEDDSNFLLSKFTSVFRILFQVDDIRVGFTRFDINNESLSEFDTLNVPNFILDDNTHKDCLTGLCESTYEALIRKKEYYVISSVDTYYQNSGGNFLSSSLKRNNIQSCILAPISQGEKLLGVLEIVSHQKNALNDVNVYKLNDVIPYIATTMSRKITAYEDRIKAVIQNECTSIHPSVLWVFEEEARRFIKEKDTSGHAVFNDIAFQDVYPLFGQIDIIGSSEARNKAIKDDLFYLLTLAEKIITQAAKEKNTEIFNEKLFQVQSVREEVIAIFTTSTEQVVINFLKKQVTPLIEHLSENYFSDRKLIEDYTSCVKNNFKDNQKHRAKFDNDIATFNRELSELLDDKQSKAQEIFPHYFERYKTDGVDHNMYVGHTISPKQKFHIIHLQNLRLWQLKTMCELERKFYEVKDAIDSDLNAASLILVYNTAISIRYRMDEKKFDIDGSYNARYEIIKKRIDKAHIKNTQERITEKGKIVIVYSNEEDGLEYKKYIHFLQATNYLANKIEHFEIENLQGVTGLQALRVEIAY